MKCQNCGKHEVNVHYSSNINGRVTEHHLCSECAEQMGYSYESVIGDSGLLDGFMQDFFTPFHGTAFTALPAVTSFLTPVRFTAMPHMGIIQDAAPAAHEMPPQRIEPDADMKKRRELNVMREQMRIAAESEDYEKAIELRNKLRELEA